MTKRLNLIFSQTQVLNTLKLQTCTTVLFVLLLLILGSCSEAEKTEPAAVITTDSTSLPPINDSLNTQKTTELFKGTYNDKAIIFSHLDFQTYTLNMGGELSSGMLNTERGYGDDRNATVYVLNSDKPKKEQQYFVRTPQGSVYMLDQNRYVVDDATFEPVMGAKPMPVVATKPAPAKSAKENTVSKKAVSGKGKSSVTVKAKKSAKKSSAKKITKSKKKKKKPVRKPRKKNRKKKTVGQPKPEETPKTAQ